MNTVDYYERMQRDPIGFKHSLVAFADSIVTTALPCSSFDIACQLWNDRCICGITNPSVCPETNKSRSNSKRSGLLEPLLMKCSVCGERVSSEHRQRQTIIHHRRNSAFPKLSPLSHDDFAKWVAHEARCRGSLEDVAYKVWRREYERDGAIAFSEEDLSRYLEKLLLVSTDSSQNQQTSPQEDPFRTDSIRAGWRYIGLHWMTLEFVPPISTIL